MDHLPLQDTKVTTVLMVRHADVHNPKDVIYGRLPRFGLSKLGREQANEVAEYLSSLRVAAVYSSPQLRARQTARIVDSKIGCGRIHVSRLISETLTGYEGRSNSILGSKFNYYDQLARPGDEDIEAIAHRMVRFVERVRKSHPGQIIVGVSHADPIMILRTALLGLPLAIDSLRGKYYPAKCSIMELACPDGADRPIVVYRPVVKDTSARAAKPAHASDHSPEDGHRRVEG